MKPQGSRYQKKKKRCCCPQIGGSRNPMCILARSNDRPCYGSKMTIQLVEHRTFCCAPKMLSQCKYTLEMRTPLCIQDTSPGPQGVHITGVLDVRPATFLYRALYQVPKVFTPRGAPLQHQRLSSNQEELHAH